MQKLLHERLREIEANDHISGLSIGHGSVPLRPSDARFLADEIEREYIPLPCDPEGKPWKIGDPVTPLNATSESHVTGYIYDGEEWFLQYRWGGRDNECNERVKNCKRPQPKVYDADGEEIKVGDTVWHIQSRDRYEVSGFGLYGVYVSDGSFGKILVDKTELTHKEPDSLEKLRDDMREHALTFWSISETYPRKKADEFVDRLSALIERGA